MTLWLRHSKKPTFLTLLLTKKDFIQNAGQALETSPPRFINLSGFRGSGSTHYGISIFTQQLILLPHKQSFNYYSLLNTNIVYQYNIDQLLYALSLFT